MAVPGKDRIALAGIAAGRQGLRPSSPLLAGRHAASEPPPGVPALDVDEEVGDRLPPVQRHQPEARPPDLLPDRLRLHPQALVVVLIELPELVEERPDLLERRVRVKGPFPLRHVAAFLRQAAEQLVVAVEEVIRHAAILLAVRWYGGQAFTRDSSEEVVARARVGSVRPPKAPHSTSPSPGRGIDRPLKGGRNAMNTLALLTAGLLAAAPAPSPEGAKPPTVTARQGGREFKYSAGPTTHVEGLALAMLGTCSVGSQATKDRWSQALQGDHVRIAYAAPRPVGVSVGIEDEVLYVSEIVLPMSGEKFPDHIFVRCGDDYRAFAKYAPQEAMLLQAFLKESKKAGR